MRTRREANILMNILAFGLPSLMYATIGFLANLCAGITIAMLLYLFLPMQWAIGIVAIVQLAGLLFFQRELYPRLKGHEVCRVHGVIAILICCTIGYIIGGSLPWLMCWLLFS